MKRSVLPEIIVVVAVLGALAVGVLYTLGVFESDGGGTSATGSSSNMSEPSEPSPDLTIPPGATSASAEIEEGDTLEISLAWGTRADLNLAVRQPDGFTVAGLLRYGEEVSPKGAIHSDDINHLCAPVGTGPYEEIVRWTNGVDPGEYQIRIPSPVGDPGEGDDSVVYDCGPDPTEFTVTIRSGGEPLIITGSVSLNQQLNIALTVK